MKLRALTVFIVASSALRLGVASMLVAAGSSATAQTTVADDGVISFRVRFGMTDKQARSWNGELSVSNGEVLELRNWAPHPSEEILGNSGWSLATRQNKARTRRAFQKEYHRGTLPYMDYPGIVVDARVVRGGSVRFKTEQGDFAINPRELRAGRALTYLDGAVVVDRVPTADVISTSDYDNDFATMLDGDNGLDGDEGQPWVAWVAYRDRGNYILTRRFDGGGWGPAVSVADQPADIYLAQMGRDPKGRPWVVWSQQDDGNFDLYGSYWDGEQWSRADRLTTNPQPDIEHALTTDAEGNLWLVWQGFRNGKSDHLRSTLRCFRGFGGLGGWLVVVARGEGLHVSGQRLAASRCRRWPRLRLRGLGYVRPDTFALCARSAKSRLRDGACARQATAGLDRTCGELRAAPSQT